MDIILWGCVVVAVFFLVASAAQLILKDTFLSQYFAIHLSRKALLRIKLSLLPNFALAAVSWPVTYPVALYYIFRALRQNNYVDDDGIALSAHQLAMSEAPTARLLLIGAFFIGLAAARLYFQDIGASLTVWLVLCWLAFSGAVAIKLFPRFSLARSAAVWPSKRRVVILAQTFTVGLAYTVVSAVVIILVTDAEPTFDGFKTTIYKIYTLRSIVWDGAGSTFARVAEQPAEGLYVAVGVLTYTVVVANLFTSLFGKLSDEDLLIAAQTQINVGNGEKALALGLEVSEDSVDRDTVIASSLLLEGSVALARGQFARNPNRWSGMAARSDYAADFILCLLNVYLRLPESTSSVLMDEFLRHDPEDQDVLCILMSFNNRPVLKAEFAERVAAYLERVESPLSQFLVATTISDSDMAKTSWQAVLKCCHVNTALHFFLQGMLSIAIVKNPKIESCHAPLSLSKMVAEFGQRWATLAELLFASTCVQLLAKEKVAFFDSDSECKAFVTNIRYRVAALPASAQLRRAFEPNLREIEALQKAS